MIRLVPVVLAACTMLAPANSPDAPANAPLKEPPPPPSLPAGSTVYHTLTGRDAQVIFTSEAPLEQIVGKANAVVGFAVPGPKDQPAKLAAASWVLPVKSLATGIPLRDEHMIGKDWLDADAFPTIEFALTRVEDVKEIKRGEEFTTWSGTLIGKLTLHGTTLEIRVPDARFSFFRESAKTKSIAPGDLLFLKCEYSVKLSDFGIKNADIPKKVSDSVKLTQTLRMSTVIPEVPPAPNKDETKEPGKDNPAPSTK